MSEPQEQGPKGERARIRNEFVAQRRTEQLNLKTDQRRASARGWALQAAATFVQDTEKVDEKKLLAMAERFAEWIQK
jgi:hypothetical protein